MSTRALAPGDPELINLNDVVDVGYICGTITGFSWTLPQDRSRISLLFIALPLGFGHSGTVHPFDEPKPSHGSTIVHSHPPLLASIHRDLHSPNPDDDPRWFVLIRRDGQY